MTGFSLDDIDINSVKVYYDQNTQTRARETSNLLQYESQHFRCKVQLQFHEAVADYNWSIGLVQACDKMYLENRYGEFGSSFWEFHPLKSRRHKMVNDSDGRQYPFYSLTSSKCEVRRGVVQDSIINLQYEDHFYPTVAWQLPYCGGVRLTDVIRRQDFWVWLVAIKRSSINDMVYEFFNGREDTLFVMKTLRWRYNLHLTFDPHQPVGKRLVKVDDVQREQPFVLNSDITPPLSAMTPPHCNAAQSLLWYPKDANDRPKILVPPRQIVTTWDTWLTDMVSYRRLNAPKPQDCRYVGEWKNDDNIGVLCGNKKPRHRHSMPESRVR